MELFCDNATVVIEGWHRACLPRPSQPGRATPDLFDAELKCRERFSAGANPHVRKWKYVLDILGHRPPSVVRAWHTVCVRCGVRDGAHLGIDGPLVRLFRHLQLVINTCTTIITLLMVFLIQHTQNRDARALQLKLDELLRSLEPARNRLINIENCTDAEIDQIERQFKALRSCHERQNGAGASPKGSS
jgi:low affinity Fe/Cu permease